MADVGEPLVRREVGLRWPRARAPERAPDRRAEPGGEVVCLIEPTPQKAEGMERDGNDRVSGGNERGARLAHECRERVRQRAAPFVLERVNHVAKRTVVAGGASRQIESWRVFAAAAAATFGVAHRELVAAAIANQSRNASYAAPARGAHRPLEWLLQIGAARHAGRREKNANDEVCGLGEHARQQCKRLAR